jgi:hypothetical protein
MTDCRNQLHKWTLLAGSRGCKACVDYCLLYGLSFSNCVAVLALDFDTPVSWARRFSDFLGVRSSLHPMSSNFSSVSTWRLCFCFLSIKSPVYSPNCELFVCWELFHHEIYFEIFADTFYQIHISHRCHSEIHISLKYTAPWRTTLLTNCNWEQMANGADNCCLMLTNHKQISTHEPHRSPWNIIPSSGP